MSYFPQGHPDFNGLRHLLLLYGNGARPWTSSRLQYSVAHLNSAGLPDDWFFDSFLFLNTKARSGNDFCADVNVGTTISGEGDFFAQCSPRPANRDDWEELVEFYFGPGGTLESLDQAVGHALAVSRTPYGRKRNVVLMLPYPHITQQSFGRITPGGPILDFSSRSQKLAQATEARLAAATWFVERLLTCWSRRRWEHLHFLGIYWMFETVYRGWDVDDHWLLKELRRRIAAKKLKFLWIPYWSTYNVHLLDDYQRYYFDLAFLQPNYMFYRGIQGVGEAAHAARARNAGIEMEYYLEVTESTQGEGERHRRFREYLNGGIAYGYMTQSACAHFQGEAALERMYHHEDPVEREFYEDIYHFIKGTYELKSTNR